MRNVPKISITPKLACRNIIESMMAASGSTEPRIEASFIKCIPFIPKYMIKPAAACFLRTY